MKLGELASRLGAELRGDAELEVTGVKGIEDAGPTEITFVANPRYASLARTTRAAAVVVEPEFQEIETATLRIKNPYHAFSRALGFFYQPPDYPAGIHPTAAVDPTAEIGEGAHMGAYVVVGAGVRLGAHATLLPHVVLYPGVETGTHFFAHAHAVVREHCILGDHVTLENGAIVGADGFGFSKNELGQWEKIPQSGPVHIGNRVDVQANACVDRATVGATKSITWSRWATARALERTHCSAHRPDWPVRRPSAAMRFLPGRWALPDIAASATAPFSPRSPASRTIFPRAR
jgi:UDP-3-O-[3-hydroxymyristoyl] glucosamine N-acyltransferase